MTTASVLLTVTTAWNVTTEKPEKEAKMGRCLNKVISETSEELRETHSTREQSLQLMREWIAQNGDIRNVRQDEAFLLRFLRHKKYSIPMAQQTLLKYLSLRKYYPEIYKNLDCEEKNLKEILGNGFIVVSPVRDRKGRRVIFYDMSKFNAAKFNCWDMCRAHMVIFETLMDDPINQICGYNHIGDGMGISGAHITSWNPSDFARILKWGEQSLPMRHKIVQLVNVPATLKYILDFATSKISQKMAHRLKVHTNSKPLHQQTDADYLPTIYGGKIELSEMIEYTQKLLLEQREKVLALDNMEILSTRGINSSRGKNDVDSESNSVEGSFRKLEID